MYYRTKSKTNWPVVITTGVSIFFLVIIIGILVVSYIKSRKELGQNNSIANTAIPNVQLSLNTLEENQEKVLIYVKVTTTDKAGLDKIVIPGYEEIIIEGNQMEYNTTFEGRKNGIYEIQAYGKNKVFGKGEIQVSNIRFITAIDPYIPEGFIKIEGTEVSTGLVVKDKSGNEYVWVPVVAGRLIRDRAETDNKYYENAPEYFQFVNSVAKYQGFYVARYEASIISSDGKEIAISKPNVLPSYEMTFEKANTLANGVASHFGYTNYQTSLVSSDAWDTILDWVNKSYTNYSTVLDYGNYSGILKRTGENSKDKVNNIFDLAGNLREWTTENYRLSEEEKKELKKSTNITDITEIGDYKIIRGGSITNSSTPNRGVSADPELKYKYVGFRFVLFMN